MCREKEKEVGRERKRSKRQIKIQWKLKSYKLLTCNYEKIHRNYMSLLNNSLYELSVDVNVHKYLCISLLCCFFGSTVSVTDRDRYW